jgi:Glycosyl hydrolases family 16
MPPPHILEGYVRTMKFDIRFALSTARPMIGSRQFANRVMQTQRASSICVRASLQRFVLIPLLCLVSGCGGTAGVPDSKQGTFGISGVITPTAGGGTASVALSGAASASATSDGSGNYSFSGLANGKYAVAPSHSGYSFNPTSQAVTINGANVTGVNFTATTVSPTYTLSGTISPASTGAGAVVTLSGAASSSTTVDASGNYSFSALANGAYTVTPSSQMATFSPTSQPVNINNANMTGVNFTATATANVIFFDDFTGTSLGSAWTVISRHGEYAQNETECNIPQQVSVANSLLTITTAVGPATCGDFNIDGSVRTPPSSWPYITGDVQWTSRNFTYGTVTIRGKMPDQSTSLWPAFWLLGSNCQVSNIYSGDTGFGGCPNLGQSSYTEIDMVECYGTGWCQFHLANPSFGIGNGCDATYTVDTNFHTFETVWTSASIKQYMDGVLETTCNQSPQNPMFLIMQIQTGGAGGTPNNALLPASMEVDFVKVTQP